MAPTAPMAFACMCIIIINIIAQCSPASLASSTPAYFVIIDGGSSGSRLHVHQYYWLPDDPLPVIEPSENKKITPGLSSFSSTSSALLSHVDQLLEFARQHVPEGERKNTPIHLQATAGLRSIAPEAAEAILAAVRVMLSASGFLFDPRWCLMISGEQEGINGWLATNYLMGVFKNNHMAGEGDAAVVPSHGVVEMGGSSLQITFVPLNPSVTHVRRLYSLTIAGKAYPLYTHSFLQYGLQAAEKLFQTLSIDSIESSGNPCYPRGVKHSATGDFSKCFELMKSIVDNSRLCDYESCSFNGIYQPTIAHEPFLAIENFFYTAQFFGHVNSEAGDIKGAIERGAPLMDALKKAGKEYCELPWSEILARHGDSSEQSKLAYFCFASAYETAVLQEGFGFDEQSNLRPAKTVNNKAIDWEIGAALLQLINNQRYEDIVVTHGNAVHHSQSTPPALVGPAAAALAGANKNAPSAQSTGVYYYTFLMCFCLLSCGWLYQRWSRPGHFNSAHWNSNHFYTGSNANWNKV